MDIGRRSNPIPFGPSQSLGQSKTAATRPAPFCGRAATSPILAGETLRVVNVRNADRRDRDRKDGSAKDNRDDESGHFPSDGVQPIFRRNSLQISADPRWSTESVTWSGPLSTVWMITNRAQSTSFEEELRQRNSARRHLVIAIRQVSRLHFRRTKWCRIRSAIRFTTSILILCEKGTVQPFRRMRPSQAVATTAGA